MSTREQDRAQRAFERVSEVQGSGKTDEAEYKRFSVRFPSLIHTCGLAQALAFAQQKAPKQYVDDLAFVVEEADEAGMTERARTLPVPLYQKLSRDAIYSATWIKRYAEALLKGDDQ